MGGPKCARGGAALLALSLEPNAGGGKAGGGGIYSRRGRCDNRSLGLTTRPVAPATGSVHPLEFLQVAREPVDSGKTVQGLREPVDSTKGSCQAPLGDLNARSPRAGRLEGKLADTSSSEDAARWQGSVTVGLRPHVDPEGRQALQARSG